MQDEALRPFVAVLRHADNALVREMTVQVVSQAVATNPQGLGSGAPHCLCPASPMLHLTRLHRPRQHWVWRRDLNMSSLRASACVCYQQSPATRLLCCSELRRSLGAWHPVEG